jgi:flagellar hook assembly protein FlgD
MPFRLVLGVYNSAGERVKQLYDGGVSAWPGNSVVTPPVIGDWGSIAYLKLLGNAQLPDRNDVIGWDGTNEQDQPVSSGTYWFKLEIHDSNDNVTAITKGIAVLRPDKGLSLAVFNGAGELVAELAIPGDADADSLVLEQGAGSQAIVHYHSPNGDGQVVWSGLNRDGLRVANGSYLIRSQGQGSSASLAFTLLRGPVDGGQLRVIPTRVSAVK